MVTAVLLILAVQAQAAPYPAATLGPQFACRMTATAGGAIDLSGRLGEGRLINSPNIVGSPHYTYVFDAGEMRGGPAGAAARIVSGGLAPGTYHPIGQVAFETADGEHEIVIGRWGRPGADGGVKSELRRSRENRDELLARGDCLFAPGSRWSPPYQERPR